MNLKETIHHAAHEIKQASKWEQRFMDLARHVGDWSKDPSTKVGAVIVDGDRRVLAHGYNGFPRYVTDSDDRYSEKSVKYRFVVHAEANAILNALTTVRGMMIYCTKYPCSECVKLIIQSGIAKVVCPAPATDGIWAEDASFATTMLRESATIVRIV